MVLVFPANFDCWSLDEQFLWGSSLLIAPVIYEDHLNKSLYLPATERWFDYYTGAEQILRGQITVPAPLDFVPLYIRGGAILPHQESAINAVASRKKPLYLIVALDQEQSAYGDLFWDDGESIDTYERSVYNYFIFNYKSKRLTIEPWTYKYPQMGDDIQLNDIKIFGLDQQPSRIVWNGQDLTPDTKWAFDTMNKVLHLKMLRLNVAKAHRFVFF